METKIETTDSPLDFVSAAQKYAIRCHLGTCHEYDGLPYTVHLQMVFQYAAKYAHLLPEESKAVLFAAAWTHDVIEDCRQTYNDVKNVCGIEVAEVVYALTNEKGKNRNERANDKYYRGIQENKCAVFVKVCDRLANVAYSKSKGSSMLDRYRKEQKHFKEKLMNVTLLPMFDELDELLTTQPHEN